ncbi:GNAT family N-acetyltransferase [Paenibacillus sp. FSL K6-2441]|uniref:GNAT family N-acetyltransferase n=1 Tax=Paenibacillus TaxID=44249 RepID=UPI0030DA91CC
MSDQTEGRLTGYFSWYSADGVEAIINAMVHPQQRRQGIFRTLLEAAATDMREQGIQACRFKVPADSDAGQHTMEHLGAQFDKSQYAMEFLALPSDEIRNPNLALRPETLKDFGFMVRCSTHAFGDSEEWTLRYFGNTREIATHVS